VFFVFALNKTLALQLILRKISKIGATRCKILRLKCTKFDFLWGSASDPAAAGELTGREGKGERKWEEKGRGG